MSSHTPCFCHQPLPYEDCCQPYHLGHSSPPTTLQLLRSRYSAYALRLADYIEATMVLPALAHFHRKDIEEAATEWLGLKVLDVSGGQALDTDGTIVFEATFRQSPDHPLQAFRETSSFRRRDGSWVYAESLCLERIDL
ncbi:MAG: YchJ family metal-binding protein [bacterium]